MATCYFAKSLVGNRIYDSKGQQIKFTIYPQDTGLLMLDSEKDAALVADLRGFSS